MLICSCSTYGTTYSWIKLPWWSIKAYVSIFCLNTIPTTVLERWTGKDLPNKGSAPTYPSDMHILLTNACFFVARVGWKIDYIIHHFTLNKYRYECYNTQRCEHLKTISGEYIFVIIFNERCARNCRRKLKVTLPLIVNNQTAKVARKKATIKTVLKGHYEPDVN